MPSPAVLEWILAVPLLVLGLILAATGRRLWGMPVRMPTGWTDAAISRAIRAIGVFWMAMAVLLFFHVWPFDATNEGVILAYAAVVLTVLVQLVKRLTSASRPRP